MKLYNKLPFFLTFIIISISPVFGQGIQVSGKVLEGQSKEPVPFATIAIRDRDSDELITGMTTDIDGRFAVSTSSKNFYVEVSFLGFVTKRVDNLSMKSSALDLGTISLEEDSQVLDEVVVAGEKSTTEFQIDKRVFNVGSDISTKGIGALEVLNRVPSVTVNIEGEVSLRGSSGVQILIDGKPSILADDQSNALGSITSDMIEKIEVITNPSAKYDAEGTSGILNIVLKKEEKKGLNGSLSLNTGAPDNHSFGLSLNRRTNKFNLFTQLGAGYRSIPRDRENINQDLVNNTRLESVGTSYRNEAFYNIILGTDYYIDKNNVLTLSGNFAYEFEDQPSKTNFRFFDDTNELITEWERVEVTDATNPKWQYELQYKKDFEDHKDHDLIISALGRFFGKDLSSEFNNTTVLGEERFPQQETRTKFQQGEFTFKLDYTDPVSEKVTLEAGTQYVINDVGNDFAVFDIIADVPVTDANLTNDFEYNQKVLGVYGTGAYKFKKWGVKAGMRLEYTDLSTLLVTTSEENNQNFLNLFPSFHTSLKFSEAFSIQGGYSRRIYRPRLWDLNPFFNISDNFNIRAGNPNLLPEYTDSYEITGVYIIGKLALNKSIYFRNTSDVIERVSLVENNVTTTTPFNIGTNKTTGVEFNAEYDLKKWVALDGNFNYNRFERIGTLENQVFDFRGDRYTMRLTSRIKLSGDLDVELTGNHQSGYLTVQSDVSATTFMDIGIRKGFLKKKAILNFGIRDVFASRIEERFTNQENFSLYSFNQRGRFITLGFSYGFGKGEAMTYSGKRR